MATCHGNFSHFKTIKNSANAMTQLMPKIILNLVCDKGDEAIKIKGTRYTKQGSRLRLKIFGKRCMPCTLFLVPSDYASCKS
jgi:hypothetical protein